MKRVLVIDDCEEFCEVVCDFLIDAGYDVLTAADEGEALDLCDQGGFDLIVCDLVLPCGDQLLPEGDNDSALVGVHLIHMLSKRLPHVPIIAVSGHLTGNALQGISQFGAIRCLSKPFTQDQLLGAVTQALREAQPQSAG